MRYIIGLLLAYSVMQWQYTQAKTPILSNEASISLLTCSAGQELYSAFGHSALYVHDPVKRLDLIYNYGTFSFNTPNFYGKFLQGKLNYRLSRQRLKQFKYEYELEHRAVVAQELRLSQTQKQAVFEFLQKNYLPDNRYYLYDFFFDNCATRIYHAINNTLADSVQFKQHIEGQAPTFRQLINESTAYQNPWANFGMNIILGSVVDREATYTERTFLPKYLSQAFSEAQLLKNAQPETLVNEPQTLVEKSPFPPSPAWQAYATPIILLSVLFVLTMLLSIGQWRKHQQQATAFAPSKLRLTTDALLYLLAGLIGCVTLFMWLGTDHKACAVNFTTLLFLPSHLFIVPMFFVKSWRKQVAYYLLASALIALFTICIASVTGMQQFHPAILLLAAIVALRGFLWYKQES